MMLAHLAVEEGIVCVCPVARVRPADGQGLAAAALQHPVRELEGAGAGGEGDGRSHYYCI